MFLSSPNKNHRTPLSSQPFNPAALRVPIVASPGGVHPPRRVHRTGRRRRHAAAPGGVGAGPAGRGGRAARGGRGGGLAGGVRGGVLSEEWEGGPENLEL